MNMAERHEQLVKIRIGTRHPITLEFPDGSRRTVHPVIEKDGETDFYPNLVRIRTVPKDQGTDLGGFPIQSQEVGDVINLPSVQDLDENEIIFVSGFVIAALESKREYSQYTGRIVSPGKTLRREDGFPEALLSWTTIHVSG